MMGYCDQDFFIGKTNIYKEKSDSWRSKALDKARTIFKHGKENPLKSVKTYYAKNFREGISKEQKDVLLNAIKFNDGRSKIIKLFEDKNIKLSNYHHNAKFQPEEYDGVEEFEPKEYEESIGEIIKLRRLKKSDE